MSWQRRRHIFFLEQFEYARLPRAGSRTGLRVDANAGEAVRSCHSGVFGSGKGGLHVVNPHREGSAGAIFGASQWCRLVEANPDGRCLVVVETGKPGVLLFI